MGNNFQNEEEMAKIMKDFGGKRTKLQTRKMVKKNG